MFLIKNKNEILKNIILLDTYIVEGIENEKELALSLVRKGTCFIVIRKDNSYKFYPSRFVGYADNNMDAHLNNKFKDGKETNPAISNVLGSKPTFDLELEKAYKKYCENLGFIANRKGSFGVERKFWIL